MVPWLLLMQFEIQSVHFYFPQDEAVEEIIGRTGELELTGRRKKRLVLVLDCVIPHPFSSKNDHMVNLQHYVIKEKKLPEKEAIVIFLDIVRIVEKLHNVCMGTLCF